jgi:4-hydroxyphenylpyruvate dioxygenase
LRVALNQSAFPGLSTRRFVEVALRAGADSVELRTLGRSESAREIGAAVRETGAQVEAVNALMDWALPDDPDPRPTLERLLEVTGESGAPLIVCVGPMRLGGLPTAEEIYQSAVERLTSLAQLANEVGVRLGLEQVGQSTTRPGAMSGIRRLSEALAIAEACGEGVVLTLDSYNLATAGERFEEIECVPVSRMGIAHLVDRDAATGARAVPDEGELDIDGFVRALARTGYEGALSLETFPVAPWPDPLAFAQRAVSTLQRIVSVRR